MTIYWRFKLWWWRRRVHRAMRANMTTLADITVFDPQYLSMRPD
jgi:hypothetical protein